MREPEKEAEERKVLDRQVRLKRHTVCSPALVASMFGRRVAVTHAEV